MTRSPDAALIDAVSGTHGVRANGHDMTDRINAVFASAPTGELILPAGDVVIEGPVTRPDGWGFRGRGGNINSPLTTLLCQDASAGLRIQGGGPPVGGFLVDANSLATLPLLREGGTGASQQILFDMNSKSSALDGIVAKQAQNDKWIQCGGYSPARRCLYITDGYGGIDFDWFHASDGGETNIYIDSAHALGPYFTPSDITFRHGIAEYNETGATNLLRIEGGYGITFDRMSFFASNDEAGPLIEITSGAFGAAHGITIKDCLIQSTGSSTIVSGSKGISVDTNCSLILDGFLQFQNLDYALWIAGQPATINLTGYPFGLKNINNKWGAVSGVDASQWIQNNQWSAIRHLSAATTDVIESSAKDDYSGQWEYRTADGTTFAGDGSGFSADVAWGRIAANIFGVGGPSQAMSVGYWTDASRPTIPGGGNFLFGFNITGIFAGTSTVPILECGFYDGTTMHYFQLTPTAV